MQFQYSLPKNEAFFRDYAGLTPTLTKLGYLAQVVSALTEFGVIFALIEASLKDFFPTVAPLAGLLGAIVGTAFLEVGLRKFIPYSVRAILYQRFTGLHAFISTFVFAVSIALLGASGYLSFQGSKELVRITAPRPQLASLAPVDSLATLQREDVLRQYSADSLSQVQRFAPALAAIRKKYSAQLEQEYLSLKRLEARERSEKRRFSTQKGQINARIASIQATQAGELARMEEDKAKALGKALEARNNALGDIASERTKQRDKVELQNTQAEAHTAGQVRRYGGGLAWFTVICMVVLLLSIGIDEIHKKGSGIEEAALPNQYYFSQSIWGEFSSMLSDKVNFHCRAFIRKLAQSTPQPPEPGAAPELWDIPSQTIKRKETGKMEGAEAPGEEAQEEPFTAMFEALFSSNGNGYHSGNGYANGNGIHNTARPVIQGFTRRESQDNGLHYPNALYYSSPGVVDAPGVVVDAPGTVEAFPGTVVEVDSGSKPCQHCGTLFKPRTTWQKFCQSVCRESWHEAKHGQPFNPGQYRKPKKAKA
jgi:hypothetical protein